jgi:formylglycine-generating enzyme required for sulfatase activity
MMIVNRLLIFLSLAICWLLIPVDMYGQLVKKKSNQSRIEKKWEKLSESLIPQDFVLLSGRTIETGVSMHPYTVPQHDSNTLENVFSDFRKVNLPPFAISKFEVTNKQYRAFVHWVADSIAMSILANMNPSYYSDTITNRLDWTKRSTLQDTNILSQLEPLYKYVSDTSVKSGGRYQLNIGLIRYAFRPESKLSAGNLAVYPDTLCWLRDNAFIGYGNIEKKYFSHNGYDNYPVVGVSWYQAQAFCDWMSRFSSFEFRLPNSAEFQSAYLNKVHISRKTSVRTKDGKQYSRLPIYNPTGYPWNSWNLFDNKGKYLANFGSIRDEYGYMLKQSTMDEAFLTAQTGSYPPSISGLYDLAGNVAEWVSDTLTPKYILVNKRSDSVSLESNDDIKTLVDKLLMSDTSSSSSYTKNLYNYWKNMGSPVILPKDERARYNNEILNYIEFAKQYSHNLQVIRSFQNPRAVMGGSWQESALFMHSGVRRIYDANTTRSGIGFRVVTDVQLTPELESLMNLIK